ncbi:hypothetical protein FIBSPDRAFT_925064 [Athelia psychrophila]|uniref:C2H2-type domain-containing protein n=1 Tax=Athelia psychrophila TaxID=1759441 RepID=A0A166VC09_9AGAM|nr:hypothetical protein FIBSPDRAFT_925064 [Fibularhizoctonia sp. CBS 109695]
MASYVYPQNDASYGYQGIPRNDRPEFDHAMKPSAKRAIAFADLSPYKESFEEGRYPFHIVLPSLPSTAPLQHQPPGQPSHVPSQDYQLNFYPDDLLGDTFDNFLHNLQGGYVDMGLPSPTISLPSSEYIFEGSGRSTINSSSVKDKKTIAHGQQFLGHLSVDGGVEPAPQESNASPSLQTTPSSHTPTFNPEASALHDIDDTFSPYGVIAPRRSARLHSVKDTSVADSSTSRYSPYVAPVATTRPTRHKGTAPALGPSSTSDSESDSEFSRGESSSNSVDTASFVVRHCNFKLCPKRNRRHWHCNLCDATFSRDIDVLRHIDSASDSKHKGITFPCHRCGGHMSRKDALDRHLNKAHRCPRCEEVFCVKASRNEHVTRRLCDGV